MSILSRTRKILIALCPFLSLAFRAQLFKVGDARRDDAHDGCNDSYEVKSETDGHADGSGGGGSEGGGGSVPKEEGEFGRLVATNPAATRTATTATRTTPAARRCNGIRLRWTED